MNKKGIRKIMKQTSKLSPSERILLADEIWDSKKSGEISKEHRKIISKRIEAENESSNKVYTWEEVKEYARQSNSNANSNANSKFKRKD